MTERWALLARFSRQAEDRWLLDKVDLPDHEFVVVPRGNEPVSWHKTSRAVSGFNDWAEDLRQTRAALRTDPDGMITVFPQLAVTAGLSQRMKRRKVVSWFFNTNLYGGVRHRLARAALANIDRFVVHHRCEREIYAKWLGLPEERFRFAHLQMGNVPERLEEDDDDDPFVFATGSGFRDYGTFFDAMGRLGYRTLVLAGPRVLAGLTPPSNVEILEGLSRGEIHTLAQRARVNAIPMNDEGLVAGTVTMCQTIRLGCPAVVTDRRGVSDYVTNGETGLVVPPYDAVAFANAVEALWEDRELRTSIARAALAFGEEHLTDAAAAASLTGILSEL